MISRNVNFFMREHISRRRLFKQSGLALIGFSAGSLLTRGHHVSAQALDYWQLRGRVLEIIVEDEEKFAQIIESYQTGDSGQMLDLLPEIEFPSNFPRDLGELCSLICDVVYRLEVVQECDWVCQTYPLEYSFSTLSDMRATARLMARVWTDRELVSQVAEALKFSDREAYAELITSLRDSYYLEQIENEPDLTIIYGNKVCSFVCNYVLYTWEELDCSCS